MANGRHKRETNARKLPRAGVIAGPVALLFTMPAIGVGVLTSGATQQSPNAATPTAAEPTIDISERLSGNISRSGGRGGGGTAANDQTVNQLRAQRAEKKAKAAEQARAARQATAKAVKAADTRLWTTETLNLWAASGEAAAKIGVVDSGERVLLTGRRADGRAEVVINGNARWVSQGYFSADEPLPGIGGQCTNGTSVASGVSPSIVKIHEAVCAAFPSITVYGTLRGGGGDHPLGKAVDIMVSGSTGRQVAEMVRANAAELGVSYVIYEQQIWSVERAGEGWRGMEDRGSATANHFDHVHVSVY